MQFKIPQFKMSQNSLFAYLLRSPWWYSFAIAVVLALIGRFILPDDYAFYALSFAIPFVCIGAIVAWQQRDVPSAARVETTLEAVAAMSWREFSGVLEQAFQRDGCIVSRTTGAADFILVKAGRTSLVSCKRWKAASHGLEPLRELKAAQEAQDAHEVIYVAAGEMTDNARRYAATHRVRLMLGPELTRLLRLRKGSAKAAN
jgi:restriction system protein